MDPYLKTFEVFLQCLKAILISCVCLHVGYMGEKFQKTLLPFGIPIRQAVVVLSLRRAGKFHAENERILKLLL